MWIWIVPVLVSYAVFAFVGEHFNPLRTFRETTARRRIKSGRIAGLVALVSCYLFLLSSHLVKQQIPVSAADESFKVTRLTDDARSNSEANEDQKLAAIGLTDVEADAGAGAAENNANPETRENKTQTEGDSATKSKTATTQPTQQSTQQANQINDRLKDPVIQVEVVEVDESAYWIYEQDPLNHTIQLNASFDKASVESFLEQNQLPDPTAIFAFDRNGSTWYALVHGSFDSYRAAEIAIAQLPQQTKLHTPWVRRFRSVRQIWYDPL